MKILYDYQMFDTQKIGGISRYHADLYKGCLDKGHKAIIGAIRSSNLYLQQLGLQLQATYSEMDNFLYPKNFWGKEYLYRIARKLHWPMKSSWMENKQYCHQLLQADHYDIFHPTYYSDTYDDISHKSPIVITIHDMIYETHTSYFGGNIQTIFDKERLAKKSQRIIAISESTKEQILRFYPFVREQNVDVVYHGIDLNENFEANQVSQKSDYLLYVGDRWAYKDFYTLLRALHVLRKKSRIIPLVCVGRPFNAHEEQYIAYLGLTDQIVNRGRVTDNELQDAYQKANMYISTSLAEGFGLPILEAMKSGTPMLLSNIPVYREVAQQAAIYFEVGNEFDLAKKITHVYDSSSTRESLRHDGNKRILEFSMQAMIDNTLHVYNSL